jgi:hypothetical protein
MVKIIYTRPTLSLSLSSLFSLASKPHPHPKTKAKKARKEAAVARFSGSELVSTLNLFFSFPSSYVVFSFVWRESDHVVAYPDNCLILYVRV